MRIASLFTTVLVSLALAACGPDPSTGDDTGDDVVEPDADPNEAPDADTTAAAQIGDACTPDAGDPMAPGTCGAGMTCLSLTGGNGNWCSKTCTSGAGDTCAAGYTGAGIPACVYGIDFGNGTAVNMCGVVCNDVAGAPEVCMPATACTGACPSTLQCTAPLMGGTPAVHVADACI